MVRWLSFWGSWPNGLFRAHQNTTGPGCIEAIAHWLVSVWEDLQNWCCRLCWSVVLWCYCWHHCMVGLSKNFGCCSWEPKEGYKVFLCLLAEVVSASWLSAFSGTPCKVLSLRLVSSAPQMEAKLFLWWNPIKNQFMWKKTATKTPTCSVAISGFLPSFGRTFLRGGLSAKDTQSLAAQIRGDFWSLKPLVHRRNQMM